MSERRRSERACSPPGSRCFEGPGQGAGGLVPFGIMVVEHDSAADSADGRDSALLPPRAIDPPTKADSNREDHEQRDAEGHDPPAEIT